jgi:hypothetical protein
MSIEAFIWTLADNPHATFQECLAWDGVAGGASSLVYAATGIAGFTYNATGCNSAAGALTVRAWHHVVGTYDGVNAKIYVDGALKNTVAIAQANKTLRFLVGRDLNSAHVFEGFVSEVAIYAAALSAARVGVHAAAANNTAIAPSVRTPGTTSPSTGSPVFLSPDAAAILAAVRKSY